MLMRVMLAYDAAAQRALQQRRSMRAVRAGAHRYAREDGDARRAFFSMPSIATPLCASLAACLLRFYAAISHC